MPHTTIKNEYGRILKEVSGFEWDAGNKEKSIMKHEVSNEECEQVFFDKNGLTFNDILHSGSEERLRIVGKTKNNRLLFVVYTKRLDKIRVISARDVNKKERIFYEKKT